MKLIILVIEIIHILIVLSILIPFFINDKNILLYYYYFCLFIICGWIIFDTKCWLTTLERNIKNDNNNKRWIIIDYLEKYLNIKSRFIEKNIISYSFILCLLSFLVLSYKTDLFYEGLFIISIYILFLFYKNKLII